MHKTEGANNASNLFQDGPPGTTLTANWLNAVQNELRNAIEGAGLTLKTASTETGDQLASALDLLIAQGAVPAGTVISYPAATPPSGYLECDGSSLLRATYADLFAVIGVTYGNVDGTHFNLPDYRGRFMRGQDNGAGRDPDAGARANRGDGTAGDNVGTTQDHEFESHNHYPRGQTGAANSTTPNITRVWAVGAANYLLNVAANVDMGPSGSTTVGGSEDRPININVVYCIKY